MLNICTKFSNRNLRERNNLEDLNAKGDNIKIDVWKTSCNELRRHKKKVQS
jgi:hypothetical protein